MQLYGTCGNDDCALPFAFAMPGQKGAYMARITEKGTPMMVRLKANARDRIVLTTISKPGSKSERERDQYILSAAK